MYLRGLASGIVITLMVAFGLAGNASAADEGNAPTMTEYSYCTDYQGGVLCSDSRYIEHRFQTESGQFIFTVVGDSSSTYTGPDGCTRTTSFTKREHWTGTTEAGVLQVSETFDTCSGEAIECTSRLHFLFTNSEFRIYKNERECVDVS